MSVPIDQKISLISARIAVIENQIAQMRAEDRGVRLKSAEENLETYRSILADYKLLWRGE